MSAEQAWVVAITLAAITAGSVVVCCLICDACRRDVQHAERVDAADPTRELIAQLTTEPGDAVTFYCGRQATVVCWGLWTGMTDLRFAAPSLLEALRAACRERQECAR